MILLFPYYRVLVHFVWSPASLNWSTALLGKLIFLNYCPSHSHLTISITIFSIELHSCTNRSEISAIVLLLILLHALSLSRPKSPTPERTSRYAAFGISSVMGWTRTGKTSAAHTPISLRQVVTHLNSIHRYTWQLFLCQSPPAILVDAMQKHIQSFRHGPNSPVR